MTTIYARNTVLGTLASMALLTCGCFSGPRFHVSVSALASPNAGAARNYTLLHANEAIKPQDLQFREYAQYLHRSLALQGFAQVDIPQKADIVILADYGVGDPQERTYSYSLPQWGQTGVSSSQTYGTATTYGRLNTYGNQGTYTGRTSYQGTTYYQPTYGITGYSTHVGTVVTYVRALELVGYRVHDGQLTPESEELWRVSAVSEGRSGDLRLVFPYLVAAAQEHIGRATEGHAVDYNLKENDKRVTDIRAASIGDK